MDDVVDANNQKLFRKNNATLLEKAIEKLEIRLCKKFSDNADFLAWICQYIVDGKELE